MIAEHGGRAVLRPIGRTKVVEGMHTEHARLGGEVSSHFFFEEFKGLEAVDFAFCRMLGVVAKAKKPLAQIAQPLRKFANSWEVNFEVEEKAEAVKRIEDKYAPLASAVNKLDGIRCDFNHDWWFILRMSNTEPLIRLTVEATSKELMEEKRAEIASLITGKDYI
jgi:phosphomannomutase